MAIGNDKRSNENSFESLAKKVKSNLFTVKQILADLNHFNQTDWIILARIVYKDIITKWSNPSNSGEKLIFKLVDETNIEVDCIAWNKCANKCNKLLKVEQTYYISNASIRINDWTKKYQFTFTEQTGNTNLEYRKLYFKDLTLL